MNLSDFQQSYHKLLVFHMDVITLKDRVYNCKLNLNQIDLLLSAINIIFSRLSVVKKDLEERKCEINEKKNEQTLF